MKTKSTETEAPADFTLGRWSILWALACSSLSDEEATARINVELPCGTRNGWSLDDGEDPWNDGAPNPRPCDDHPETHRHFKFTC